MLLRARIKLRRAQNIFLAAALDLDRAGQVLHKTGLNLRITGNNLQSAQNILPETVHKLCKAGPEFLRAGNIAI